MSSDVTRRRGVGRRMAIVLMTTVLVAAHAGCGDDGDDPSPNGTDSGEGQGSPVPGSPPENIETGGIEVDAPEGWQAIALPSLGFGVAIPDGWEAVVLSEEGLDSLRQASPMVPGFTESAMVAAGSGAVFYAAGVEDSTDAATPEEGANGEAGAGDESVPVVDLKVRADTDSGVTDVAGLEDYARRLDSAGLSDAEVQRVADAPQPVVEIRYRAPVSIDGHDGDDDGPSAGDGTAGGVNALGTERLVLADSGVVYSFIVTSEIAGTQDELVPRLLDTVAFPPS